jgi:hypothetical protein
VAEPVTVLTDYVLAAVAVWLGVRLAREPILARRLWGAALLGTAVAAALGGSEHGFRPRLPEGARWWMWEATYLSIGAANALLLAGAARVALGPRARRVAEALVLARFAVFAVVVSGDHRFQNVVVDFALTLLLLGVFAAWAASRHPGLAGWLAAAIAVSLLGAAVQGMRLAPHAHFNHNDLFHVLQTLGVVCFFRAAQRFVDRAP